MNDNQLTKAAAFYDMINALDSYIETISDNMEYMKRAAIICSTAMSSDSVSMEMVAKLDESRKLLEGAVDQAARLRKNLENEAATFSDVIEMIRNN